jgi:hypothetical protein
MAKYAVLTPNGTINIKYTATGPLSIHFTPNCQPLERYEMICVRGDGTVYDEEGPGDRARMLRLCLPGLQHERLPAKVKKALSSIR